jgi:hypothetical protein
MPQRDFRSVAHFLCRKKRIEKFRHVRLRHSPEYGSSQGLAQYDPQIENPTLADELAARTERDAVILKIKAQLVQEKDRNVAEDRQMLIQATSHRGCCRRIC